jgi:hypothetical protein
MGLVSVSTASSTTSSINSATACYIVTANN